MSDDPAATPERELELLRRAQSGDENAFGELVRAYYEAIFRLVYSVVRNEHDARDVCQEVWLVVWRKLRDFRGESRFSTWLHPIAVRRALDHLRRRRRWFDRFVPIRSERDDADEIPAETVAEPAAPGDPRDDLERVERNNRFERALASLPPKHRTVLALREIEGLSYEQIAQAMKCRPGTVMSRLFHARRLLLRKLKDIPCE